MEESAETREALGEKIDELLTESDNETGQSCFEEEMIEEVMQELYKEIAGSVVAEPASPPGKHLEPPSSSSSSSAPLMDSGKNGSCGASISDSTSTVMAGIEVGDSGRDELDDEWLGRVLSWEQGQPVESTVPIGSYLSKVDMLV